MLEPPSAALTQRLMDWRLCRPVDLRRARRRVRLLSRDLPAFDSVWIDALVQDGRLTPYQARVLESEQPGDLLIHGRILLDELGRGRFTTTWLARTPESQRLEVLQRVRLPSAEMAPAAARFKALVDRGHAIPLPAVATAHSTWEDDRHSLWVAAPFVTGIPLSELLVRRGRFPAAVVLSLARQLAAGLVELHRRGLVHGEIRPTHIRITPNGQAVLVEAGYRPALTPVVTMHAGLSLEAYDSLAPEVIGAGQSLTAASDLYSLGCVLWQLLAGRPTVPSADPLAKLAAHQSAHISDVREWTPETPPELADWLQRLLDRQPSGRPGSAEELLTVWGRPTARDRWRLASFQGEFSTSVPHLRGPSSRPATVTGVTVAAVLVGLAASVGWWGTPRPWRAELLAWMRSQPSATTPDSLTGTTIPEAPRDARFRPIPAPTAEGVVMLADAGPYETATLQFPGTLTIRAAPGVQPLVLVRSQPLRLAAPSVRCLGVTIRYERPSAAEARPRALLLVETQQLELDRCTIDTGQALGNERQPLGRFGQDENSAAVPAGTDSHRPNKPSSSDPQPVGLAWRPIDVRDLQAGRLVFERCQWHGDGAAMALHAAARSVQLRNVFKRGSGALLEWQDRTTGPEPQLSLSHLTLRQSGPLIRWRRADETLSPPAPWLSVNANHCVLDVLPTSFGVLELAAPSLPLFPLGAVVWNGTDSVVVPDVPLVSWWDTERHERIELPSEEFGWEGLAVAAVEFAGLPTSDVADSVVTAVDAPRVSSELPGIAAEAFADEAPTLLGPLK